MSFHQTAYARRSIKGILLVLAMPILLIEAGAGCAELRTSEAKDPAESSVSVYALSRGKGVPDEARNALEKAREILKAAQEEGTVTRFTDRRIGLEGETRLCAEFGDEQVADKYFGELHRRSLGVDLVNIKREACPP